MHADIAERIRYLTLTDASKVWMPDTFFRNEKIGQFHNILTPNLYIRIFPDGDVLYSIRWVQRTVCQWNYRKANRCLNKIHIFNFHAKFSGIN